MDEHVMWGETVIIGMGNPLLSDDGVGIAVAHAVAERLQHVHESDRDGAAHRRDPADGGDGRFQAGRGGGRHAERRSSRHRSAF